MPTFSKTSMIRLSTCAAELQAVMNEAIKHVDITIISGHRNFQEQARLFEIGRSRKRGGKSVHNRDPSDGVDFAPFPIDWNDLTRFYYCAGIIQGIALKMGINLRWGGDWDGDGILADNTFNDLGHFEVRR